MSDTPLVPFGYKFFNATSICCSSDRTQSQPFQTFDLAQRACPSFWIGQIVAVPLVTRTGERKNRYRFPIDATVSASDFETNLLQNFIEKWTLCGDTA